MRQEAQQPLAPAAIDLAEPAIELAQGLAALRLGFGGGEIGDRLGLGQIELAVQKSAAGELAGLGEPQAHSAERRHDCRQHATAAMQLQFGDIFAGNAVRRREPQRQAVIQILAALGIAEPDMPGQPRRRQFSSERAQGRARFGPGQADDRDGGAPGGGRRRVDSIGRRLAGPQCFGGSWSGVSINRLTRPPFFRCVSTISSMSCVFS